MSSLRTVSLPEDLCALAENKFRQRFNSLDDLLVHLLGELLREDAAKMDKRELEIIEQRLRGLGYV